MTGTSAASPIPLIYIASNGRSGSTVLDLLLGALPGVWTVGEVQLLTHPWVVEHSPCGCGAAIPDCPFWGPVLERLGPVADGSREEGVHGIDYFRRRHRSGKVLRPALLPGIWRGRSGKGFAAAIDEYGDHNAALFTQARQAAEHLTGSPVRWLVDASKDPYRLLWLQESGRFDIRVIHLLKDPRAYVHSMTKFDDHPGWPKAARFAGRWLVENAMFARLARVGFPPGVTRRLHYETLAGDPYGTMASLCRWLGVEMPAASLGLFRDQVNHGVAGNRSRWETRPIALDESWRTRMPAGFRRLATALTFPGAWAWGYGPGAREGAGGAGAPPADQAQA